MARRSSAQSRLVLVLWPVLQACAAPDIGTPLFTQYDSAGIQIVESRLPQWGDSSHWRVDPEPVLDLTESGAGDPHIFYTVRGMKRLSDGSIVVANAGSNGIRLFSAAGRFLGSTGGLGEGPGEFSNMQQLELAGDTILVRDIRGRVTVFGPGLVLIRTMVPHPGIVSIHYLGDGTVVARVVMHYPEVYGLVRYPEALLLYDLEGVRGDSIGWTPGGEEYVTEVLSGAPLFRQNVLVDTYEGRIFSGASDYMQVEELAASGETARILRIPGFPLALSAKQVQAERDARLDIPLPQGMSLPPHLRQAIEDMPSPTTRPAYADMLVDPTGAVWLRPFRGFSEEGGPEDWQVLDSDGRWLGSVEIPENFRVRDIGTHEILGVCIDDLDVQHPRVLRLSRGEG